MKELLRTTSVAAFLLLLAGAFTELAAQTPLPFDELGAGPKATAMGQAFAAVADDASSAYYNPAGLAQVETPFGLTLGYMYAKPKIRVKFDSEPVKNPYLGRSEFDQTEDFSTRGLYVAVVSNFAHVPAFSASPVSRRLAVGFTLFTNLPEINQFDNPQRPQDPYVFKYNERWSLLCFALSGAVKVTDWLFAGGGIIPRVDALQDTTGSWIALNRALDPNDPSQGFRLNLKQTTEFNVSPIGGVLIRPPFRFLRDALSIGVTYRGELWGFYGTGPTGVDVVIERPGQDPIVIFKDPGGRTVDYIGYTPEQVTGGIAVRPCEGLLVAFDLTWKHYSEFHFFWDILPLEVVDGVQQEHPFHDVWVPRVGIRYAFDPGLRGTLGRLDEISLLAGYYREPSPVPDMSGTMNILDADQNVVSGGFGLRYDATWTGYVQLEAFFQAHLFEENRIPNDRDPLFGPVTVSGEVYNMGASLSIVY
ncbi:MAG: hypothetical protein AB1640_15020 [bacterium]